MQWWNDLVSFLSSPDGQTVITSAVIPFIAILVAGFIAAAIGRGSTKRLLTLNDRENRIAAVATMIGAARRASVWNTLPLPEQQHADHVASEADVRVRLLAVPGSGLAADWANHEIQAMKKNSVSFSFQAEQSLIEFRDRMVTWQAKPGRARKLFKADLETWAYDDAQNKSDIVSQQQAWAAAQVKNETGPISTMKPTAADPAPATEPALPAAPVTAGPAAAAATAAGDSASEPTRAPQRPAFAPAAARVNPSPTVKPIPSATSPVPAFAPSDEPALTATSADNGDLVRFAPSDSSDGAPTTAAPENQATDETDARPTLVEPSDRDDQDVDPQPPRSLEDALAFQPVTANTVNRRISPPRVGDDGR